MSSIERSPSTLDKAEIIKQFIKDLGLNINRIRNLPLTDRAKYLAGELVSLEDITRHASSHSLDKSVTDSSKLGLAFIKPELEGEAEHFLKYFKNLGCNPQILPKRYLSHNQWLGILGIYGYIVGRNPEIMYLYVVQRALGVTPIIFKSLETEAVDVVEDFNKKYCGYANKETPGTIRWEVARPFLLKKGFSTMTGLAADFDPFYFYRYQTQDFNLGVFNGIHIPNSVREFLSNWQTIFSNNTSKTDPQEMDTTSLLLDSN